MKDLLQLISFGPAIAHMQGEEAASLISMTRTSVVPLKTGDKK